MSGVVGIKTGFPRDAHNDAAEANICGPPFLAPVIWKGKKAKKPLDPAS